jgi:hypothetical protein
VFGSAGAHDSYAAAAVAVSLGVVGWWQAQGEEGDVVGAVGGVAGDEFVE